MNTGCCIAFILSTGYAQAKTPPLTVREAAGLLAGYAASRYLTMIAYS
jgi:hypothetical protein